MTSNADFLSSYFAGTPSGVTAPDIAKFMLLNAERKDVGKKKPLTESDPSLIGRIIDVLSRPNYAVAEFVNQDGNPKGLLEGLTGEKKTTFGKVLKDKFHMDNNVLTGGLGLALDIGLDPTTYIGTGAIKGALKNGKKVATAEKPLAETILSKGEPVYPESFGKITNLPVDPPAAFRKTAKEAPVDSLRAKLGFNTSQPTLPGMGPHIKMEPPVDRAITKGTKELPGQLPLFKLPKKGSEIVGEVAESIPEAVAKIVPVPKPTVTPDDLSVAKVALSTWAPKFDSATPGVLNQTQQAALYEQAAKATGKSLDHPETLKMFIAMENVLEHQGFSVKLLTGEKVRLSDVIIKTEASPSEVVKAFKRPIKEGDVVWQAVQDLKARNAIQDAPKIKQIVDASVGSSISTKTSGLLSEVQIDQFDDFVKKFAQATAKAEDVSPAGVRATKEILIMALSAGKSSAQVAVDQYAGMINDILAGGKNRVEISIALTRALEQDLGKLPKWAVNENKALEFMMARVATWWGQSDLRPLSLNAIASSAATAATRGKVLDGMFKGYTAAESADAFKLAQGGTVTYSAKVEQLATQIKRTMDNLISPAAGKSVITKSAVNMAMLNKWLDHYRVGFNFSTKKTKDLAGRPVDYSNGTDWLKSWQTAEIKDEPKVFMFKIQQAVEQATREKALFEEIGQRFGTTQAGKGFRTKIEGYPYLEGYYFTDDITKQIPRVVKDWTIPLTSKSPLLRHYDRVLSMWKSGVTIYRPAHHIRNMTGDVYLGWMDGVNSIRPYTLAAKVQRSMRGAYKELADVDRLVEAGLAPRTLATPKPNEIIFRNKSGVGFTAEQISAVAHQKGLLEQAATYEDILDMGSNGKSILDFKPFDGRVQQAARTMSEFQGHNARLAHFIDKIIKSRGSNLEDIFEQASRRARKWHPSGLDLTAFEKQYLRRVIPFYSWIRKSTPLMLEGLVMNPGKVLIAPKVVEAIQGVQGIETNGRDDPFPVDQLFPEWIKEQGLGPISSADGLLGSFSDQSPPGYVIAGAGLNPLQDMLAQFAAPGKTLTGSLTPAVGIPFELMSGRKSFTGEPIIGPDARPNAFSQYVGENIPIWSALQGITGITPTLGETKKSTQSDTAYRESLVNLLTAAGIRGTGPFIDQARYETLAPGKMQKKIGREELTAELRRQLSGDS